MAQERDEYMTAEELRNRLYHSLRSRGLVDSIKTQLRNSLVTELQQSGHNKLSVKEVSVPEEGSLLHRAANSLVIDHLRRCGYEYSLSVFLPETGTAQDKILNTKDLLQLLHISSQSKLYRKLASNVTDHGMQGFLWQLLCELSALYSCSSQESGSQTDVVPLVPLSSLDDKLIRLDEFYSSKRDDHLRKGATAVEERILSYQRMLDERSRSELKLEIARFQENELSMMRLQEKEQCRKELDMARKEMERTYQVKLEGLSERERNAMERIQREQEIQSKQVYAQRQTVLEEIEAVRQREALIKREAEANQREGRLQEERTKAREEAVRRREAELRKLETEYEQRLHNELTKFKIEEQARFLERTQNLNVREIKIKEDERRVGEDKEGIQTLKNDLRDKTARNNELETWLQEARHKEIGATRHNEFLNAKLREMTDYSTLKEENAVLRNELESVRLRLAEMAQLYEKARSRTEELLSERGRPTHHSLLVQGDLDRARQGIRQEQSFYEQHKTQTEARLKDEIDRNREMLHNFEEQTLQQKEMVREVTDLRQQLLLTQHALNNEVYRKPRTEDGNENEEGYLPVEMSLLREGTDPELQLYNGQISMQRSSRLPRYGDDEVYNDVDAEGELTTQPRRLYDDWSDDNESQAGGSTSGDIVAEAKYRLKSLEKEAQNLEQTYRDFHYRLTNVHSIPPDTGRGPAKKSLPAFTAELTRPTQNERPTFPRVKNAAKASPRVEQQRPLSSTPCKQGRQSNDLEDSFSELHSLRGRVKTDYEQENLERMPVFSLSQLSDTQLSRPEVVMETEERRERKLITLADLEARPGSPNVVVLSGSDSANSKQGVVEEDLRVETEPVPSQLMAPKTRDLPILNLDTDLESTWKGQQASLDSAWKSSNVVQTGAKDDEEEKGGADEEYRRWEEEKERREEERRRQEQEDWEREQRELENLQKEAGGESQSGKDGGTGAEVGQQTEAQTVEVPGTEDNIDPVMKQYMAMVQQQKKKDLKDRTPTQSENDISIAEDPILNTDNGSGNEFDWG